MYLSRISLSPEAADDVRFGGVFHSPYQLHQEIWTLFSDDPNRRRDFLYRLDQDGRNDGRPRVFSLSRRAPRPLPGVWQVETREFHPAFEVGDRLRFVLRANPVVARSGSRHDVVTDAIRRLKEQAVPRRAWPSPEQIVRSACIEWLARRAETNGFAFSAGEVEVERHEVQSFTKPDGWPVRLAVCDFEGVLRVTDREPFLAALRTGIGPAKGFGNGLLLCEPGSGLRRRGRVGAASDRSNNPRDAGAAELCPGTAAGAGAARPPPGLVYTSRNPRGLAPC